MTRKPLQIATIAIDSLSKKGYGVGTTQDEKARRVEVPFTMPGDIAEATLVKKRGGIYTSRLNTIQTPSPERIAPRCIHFGVCGGCRWQQISYEQQLAIKQQKIEELFASLIGDRTSILPIVGSVSPWHYRNKMEFTFSSDAAGNRYLGLIIDGSRGKVVNLTECHLVNPWVAELLVALRGWWASTSLKAYHPHTNTGALRTLTVREGINMGDRLVMLTVSGNPDYAIPRHYLDAFVAAVRTSCGESQRLSIFLRIHQATKGQETQFYEMLLHGPDHIREQLHIQAYPKEPPQMLEFTVSPSAFFQPNTRQAQVLYSQALQLLDITLDSVVYDLYCGTGTLGISVAARAKQVVGIEISPESSLDARTNAVNNRLDNVVILTGAVRDVIKDIREQQLYPSPDIVIVDPPRVGLDPDTIAHLIDLQPRKILYISCNPVTQAENIKDLISHGYALRVVQPVDQFPHTVHIENIAILVKDS